MKIHVDRQRNRQFLYSTAAELVDIPPCPAAADNENSVVDLNGTMAMKSFIWPAGLCPIRFGENRRLTLRLFKVHSGYLEERIFVVSNAAPAYD